MLRVLMIFLTTAALATPPGGVATPVEVGDFAVTVTHIERDADERFAARGNPEPEEGRAYAVIGLAIENRGEETISSRELHLDPFVDGIEVDRWMCPTVYNGTIANHNPELRPGARAEIEVCAQLPEGELQIEAFVNGKDPVILELPAPSASPEASPAP